MRHMGCVALDALLSYSRFQIFKCMDMRREKQKNQNRGKIEKGSGLIADDVQPSGMQVQPSDMKRLDTEHIADVCILPGEDRIVLEMHTHTLAHLDGRLAEFREADQ
jgi:hypothetical protein